MEKEARLKLTLGIAAVLMTGCEERIPPSRDTATQALTVGATQSGTPDVPDCPGLEPHSTPVACYALSLIGALGTAHHAALKVPDTAGANGNVTSLATEVFYASRMQRGGLDRAISTLQSYLTARDSIIRESAKEIVFAFNMLRDVSIKRDSALQRRLDGDNPGGTGSVAQEMAELKAARHDGASLLVLGVILSTHAMVEPDAATGLSRLSISSLERNVLMSELRQQFAAGLKTRSSDYAVAASMLDEFLRREWTTRK